MSYTKTTFDREISLLKTEAAAPCGGEDAHLQIHLIESLMHLFSHADTTQLSAYDDERGYLFEALYHDASIQVSWVIKQDFFHTYWEMSDDDGHNTRFELSFKSEDFDEILEIARGMSTPLAAFNIKA